MTDEQLLEMARAALAGARPVTPLPIDADEYEIRMLVGPVSSATPLGCPLYPPGDGPGWHLVQATPVVELHGIQFDTATDPYGGQPIMRGYRFTTETLLVTVWARRKD